MGIAEELKKIEAKLTCPVCKNIFTEPKLTPCLHNICLGCLNEIGKKNPYSSHIDCPVCQAEIEKPALVGVNGFSTFASDVYLVCLLDLYSTNYKHNLEHCSGCEQNCEVFSFCFECGDFFCSKCTDEHAKSTNGSHLVIKNKDMIEKDVQAVIFRQMLACHHQRNRGACPVQFYCRHCSKCICQLCSSTAKEKHTKISLLRDELEDASKILEGEIKNVTKRAEEITEGKKLIEQRLIDLDKEIEKVKRQVHFGMEKIVNLLKQHEKEMFSHIDGVRDVKKENLESQLKTFDICLLQVKSSIDFTQDMLQRNVTAEVVTLKEHVNNRLQQLAQISVDSRPIESACVGYVPNHDVLRHIQTSVLGHIASSNTDVISSKADGEGLSDGAVGEEAVFTVTTCDLKGEACYSSIDSLGVRITSSDRTILAPTMRNNENGIYEISYLPYTPGKYKVEVQVGEKDIKGSPFEVNIRPPVLMPVKAFGSHAGGTGHFSHPHGITVSDAGEIAVTDTQKNCIHIFDSGGKKLLDIGKYGIDEGQLNYPAGIAFDKANKCILVADRDNHRIQIFNRKTGKFVKKFGIPGIGDGQFNKPTGVNVDKDGRIVVTDWQNHRVQVFSAEGKFLFNFGTGIPEKLKHPREAIFLSSQNIFVVSDTGNNVLKVFDEKGNFLRIIGKPGNKKGELYSPRGLVVDKENRLIVCDFDNHRLQFFNLQDGKALNSFGSKGINVGQFNNPLAVAVINKEEIIVTDWRNDRVQIFSMGPKWKMAYLCDAWATNVNNQ